MIANFIRFNSLFLLSITLASCSPWSNEIFKDDFSGDNAEWKTQLSAPKVSIEKVGGTDISTYKVSWAGVDPTTVNRWEDCQELDIDTSRPVSVEAKVIGIDDLRPSEKVGSPQPQFGIFWRSAQTAEDNNAYTYRLPFTKNRGSNPGEVTLNIIKSNAFIRYYTLTSETDIGDTSELNRLEPELFVPGEYNCIGFFVDPDLIVEFSSIEVKYETDSAQLSAETADAIGVLQKKTDDLQEILESRTGEIETEISTLSDKVDTDLGAIGNRVGNLESQVSGDEGILDKLQKLDRRLKSVEDTLKSIQESSIPGLNTDLNNKILSNLNAIQSIRSDIERLRADVENLD